MSAPLGFTAGGASLAVFAGGASVELAVELVVDVVLVVLLFVQGHCAACGGAMQPGNVAITSVIPASPMICLIMIPSCIVIRPILAKSPLTQESALPTGV
jgi:hypothetical protein